jgi:hypothetical protein
LAAVPVFFCLRYCHLCQNFLVFCFGVSAVIFYKSLFNLPNHMQQQLDYNSTSLSSDYVILDGSHTRGGSHVDTLGMHNKILVTHEKEDLRDTTFFA